MFKILRIDNTMKNSKNILIYQLLPFRLLSPWPKPALCIAASLILLFSLFILPSSYNQSFAEIDIGSESLEDVISADEVTSKNNTNENNTNEGQLNPEAPPFNDNVVTEMVYVDKMLDDQKPKIDMVWFVDNDQGKPRDFVKSEIQMIIKGLKNDASLKIGVYSGDLFNSEEINKLNKDSLNYFNTEFSQFGGWFPHTRALDYARSWMNYDFDGHLKQDQIKEKAKRSNFFRNNTDSENYKSIFVFATTEDSKKYPKPKKGFFSFLTALVVIATLGTGLMAYFGVVGFSQTFTFLGISKTVTGAEVARRATSELQKMEQKAKEDAEKRYNELVSKDQYQNHGKAGDLINELVGTSNGQNAGWFLPQNKVEEDEISKAHKYSKKIRKIDVWSFVVGGDKGIE